MSTLQYRLTARSLGLGRGAAVVRPALGGSVVELQAASPPLRAVRRAEVQKVAVEEQRVTRRP